MVVQHNTMTTETSEMEDFHKLSSNWTLYAHKPHDTNWSLKSYIQILNFDTVEQTVALMETLPPILVENCMLFLMKDIIKPTWEDPKNRNGGCFSYRVSNKQVYKTWKELSYVVVGETVSKQLKFVNNVTGITISPKKNFCIIKIWMGDCSNQDPTVVTNELKTLFPDGCLFKKHSPEY